MTKLFEQAIHDIPQDVRERVSLNFDIIDQISAILQRKGMTQRDLANLMGKRESEISKWMRGTHNFTLSTISAIQKALGEKIIDTPLNFSKAKK
ncbi:helix-turn-helix domain-containing protein [Chitinophaga japonensis]|uniref:Helix-turn-helix protein n=1 Tax=Chitinophaga japonensis TaxID=104662 RepID=A0A562T577_CHIJA|nr:helix-turn-helix transcriptional regulator [Chitinophaga japonensis]TWI88697.1 helix-turn-helix protein [Chitinophaga japonensis]